MERSGKSRGSAPTTIKDATLQQHALGSDAFELEKLLKQFAYQPIYFIQSGEETGKAKARLKDLLKARWGTCDRDVVQKGRALLEWVLLCPPLLNGQPGFEWVQQSFITMLQRRLHYRRLHYRDVGQKANRDCEGRLEGVDDQLFWEIVEAVRGKLNKGHPQTLVKDYERANLVFNLTMLKDLMTGNPIELSDATMMVARYEVLQRVTDADHFLREVGGVSKNEAKRITGSWGLAQRNGAVGFLTGMRNCTTEDAERLIDDWNAKRKVKRAKGFLIKKHNFSESQAEDLVVQWKLDRPLGKVTAIGFLTQNLRYKDSQAETIVSRWGTTGEVENVDRSPIYHSLRRVKAQGHWSQLKDIVHTDKGYEQELSHIVLETMSGTSSKLKDERYGVKVLKTNALLETIQGRPKSQVRKTHSEKTKKRRKK
jgi:hypothetical protein